MNVNKLRGLIAEAGLSQRKVPHQIGITEKTFYSKMDPQKECCFLQREIQLIIDILKMPSTLVMEVFFPNAQRW